MAVYLATGRAASVRLCRASRGQILCWGVRNMKSYELRSVRNPAIEFECAGKIVTSEVMTDVKQHPNFADPFLFMEIVSDRAEGDGSVCWCQVGVNYIHGNGET